MFKLFKKKEDIWSGKLEDGVLEEEEEEEEENEIGILIHFTPIMTYVYIITDGQVWSDSGTFAILDTDGNEIEITGTVISTCVDRMEDVDQKLNRLGVKGDVLRLTVTGADC